MKRMLRFLCASKTTSTVEWLKVRVAERAHREIGGRPQCPDERGSRSVAGTPAQAHTLYLTKTLSSHTFRGIFISTIRYGSPYSMARDA